MKYEIHLREKNRNNNFSISLISNPYNYVKFSTSLFPVLPGGLNKRISGWFKKENKILD